MKGDPHIVGRMVNTMEITINGRNLGNMSVINEDLFDKAMNQVKKCIIHAQRAMSIEDDVFYGQGQKSVDNGGVEGERGKMQYHAKRATTYLLALNSQAEDKFINGYINKNDPKECIDFVYEVFDAFWQTFKIDVSERDW